MTRKKRHRGNKSSVYWSNLADNMISRGFSSLILFLALATLAIVVASGFAYYILAPGSEMSLGESFWTAFSFTTNPELPAFSDASKTVTYAVITFVVVIAGLLVTSALVGIIATALSTYYENLQRGFSPVLSEGHISILGFNDNVQVFIEELCEAHDKDNPVEIMFMDDKLSREEMEIQLSSAAGISLKQLKKEHGCTVICRNGNMHDLDDLRRCAVDKSKAIIINDYADSAILKTLLAVTSLLRSNSIEDADSAPTIVCAFREEQFARAAFHAGHEKILRVLSLSDTLSNLIAKTCYQPGLSNILAELYSQEGSEFYVREAGPFIGRNFDDLTNEFETAIPIGICRPSDDQVCGYDIILNEPSEPSIPYDQTMRIKDGDFLIVLAKDPESSERLRRIGAADEIKDYPLRDTSEDQVEPKRILVLGYDETFDKTILNLARYYTEHWNGNDSNCHIKLLYRIKREQRVLQARKRFVEEYNNKNDQIIKYLDSAHGTDNNGNPLQDIEIGSTIVSFQCSHSNYLDLPVLEKVFLGGEQFDHVIVLSDLQLGHEEADTEMLLTLLYLKAIADNARKGLYGKNAIKPFYITSEIQNMENVNIAYNEYVSDYIISWKFIAALQVQISENRHIYKIMRDLLKSGGSEIQLEHIKKYLKMPDDPNERLEIDFDRLAQTLRDVPNFSKKRVLLGYLDVQTGKHVLCPDRNADGRRMVKLAKDDMLIVIKTTRP